jgi:hypothetical protein
MYRRLKHRVDTLWLALTAAIGASFAMLLACYGRFSEVRSWRCGGLTTRADALGRRMELIKPQTQAEFDAAGTRINLSTDASLNDFEDSVTCETVGSV